MNFDGYDVGDFYDEMFLPDGTPRPEARALVDRIEGLPRGEFMRRHTAAEQTLLNTGITFTVYGDEAGTERIFPFDVVPRIIAHDAWDPIERGLKQRVEALNRFIDDVYHDRTIIRDGLVPAEVVESSQGYRRECAGLNPPRGVWCHVTGTDLVRDRDGTIYVLEDNLRCPSGVSYVLENRAVMTETFPIVFEGLGVRPVQDYPSRLLTMLEEVAPESVDRPSVALLTPGVFNSAYFEHSFLAQQMGIELVEGRDLEVVDDRLQMRTTRGYEPIDVLYRRIDDDFLDPTCFRSDSLLGVPGLMDLYQRGRVTLVNAPGTGVADDKVVYAYVPEMIRYYLDQDPILPNVPTYLCWRDDDRRYVLDHLAELVMKPADESGGYGLLIGPAASQQQLRDFAERIEAEPRNYIAQPTLALSRVPTRIAKRFEGRHVDLRPYILYGRDRYVLPGGLTRVALRKGSLVVNSSQGGGSKDTWVLAAPTAP